MKQRYEGLLVLNIKGTEEGAKEVIERLEGDFKKEGARVESVQKMDRRQFTYVAGPLESGFYVNFIFQAEPQVIEKLRARFKLDDDIYRQNFMKLASKKEKAVKAAA
ncbi:MAG: small subunit ribosomal protein [Chthoniobacter sp.]|jgi:small subunit ribosomal protein S6|nr:small subunit ribosomal protein [Chthoniobacter sp.]